MEEKPKDKTMKKVEKVNGRRERKDGRRRK